MPRPSVSTALTRYSLYWTNPVPKHYIYIERHLKIQVTCWKNYPVVSGLRTNRIKLITKNYKNNERVTSVKVCTKCIRHIYQCLFAWVLWKLVDERDWKHRDHFQIQKPKQCSQKPQQMFLKMSISLEYHGVSERNSLTTDTWTSEFDHKYHYGFCSISYLNSLWPRDVKWWQGTGSILVQIMAFCLMALHHYLNQCWLIIQCVCGSRLRAISQKVYMNLIYNTMTSSNGSIFRVTGPLCWEFTHKGQWRGGLMLSLICAWMSGWINNREAGDLRRHRVHCDVIVMTCIFYYHISHGPADGTTIPVLSVIILSKPILISIKWMPKTLNWNVDVSFHEMYVKYHLYGVAVCVQASIH